MGLRIPKLLRRPMFAVPAALFVVALAAVAANAALGAATGAGTTDSAASNGQSQGAHAIVVNHGDGRYRYAITFKVVHVSGDVVDPQNAAVAVAANCTDCTTVAISMQGVLVYGDPAVFAPENLALAYNENCNNCQTLAEAYQEIVPTDGKVRITGAGRREIAAIRHDVDMIRHDDLTLPQIDVRVDADAGRLLTVLRNDVVPIGKPAATGAPQAPTDSATDPASPTASESLPPSEPATPTTSTPPESTTPSPSETPTQSASPTAG